MKKLELLQWQLHRVAALILPEQQTDSTTFLTDEEDDGHLFRKEVEQVQPLRSSQSVRIAPPKPPQENIMRLRAHATASLDSPHILSDSEAQWHPVTGDDEICFVRGNMAHQRLKKFRAGQPLSTKPAGPELDLHGMNIEQARTALYHWVQHLQHKGFLQALLITGKGNPSKPATLKSHAAAWLKQIEAVQAYCTAQPNDGGRGAFYVLLKRIK